MSGKVSFSNLTVVTASPEASLCIGTMAAVQVCVCLWGAGREGCSQRRDPLSRSAAAQFFLQLQLLELRADSSREKHDSHRVGDPPGSTRVVLLDT